MFDTIAGLPIHPLAVHAVVVLLPIMAIVTVAVAVWPAWRMHTRWVVVGNVIVFVSSVVARQTGEALYGRIGQLGRNDQAEEHAFYGGLLPLFALFLVVAAVVMHLLRERPKLAPVGIVIAVVAAVAGIGWTVITGDTGARSTWESLIESTN